MSKLGASLPGNRRRPPKAVPADPMHNPQRRTNAELDAAILALLAETQPLPKWQLRERLHEPEAHVYRRLMALRDAGKIKAVGRRYNARQWVLRHFEAPQATPFNPAIKASKPTQQAATSSWWVDTDRSTFQQRAQAELRRMAESRIGQRSTMTNLNTD